MKIKCNKHGLTDAMVGVFSGDAYCIKCTEDYINQRQMNLFGTKTRVINAKRKRSP